MNKFSGLKNWLIKRLGGFTADEMDKIQQRVDREIENGIELSESLQDLHEARDEERKKIVLLREELKKAKRK